MDYFYIDPADANRQLLVIADACATCASSGALANVPAGSRQATLLGPSLAGFQLPTLARSASAYYHDQGPTGLPPGYATNGIVLLAAPGADPAYAVVVVTLPTSEKPTATQILNSVHLTD